MNKRVSQVLQRSGYRTLTATDGDEGIEVFARHANEIDLVLLDMNLPAKSGDEVLPLLKRMNPNVKVLLTSGFGLDERSRELLSKSAHFIAKPFASEMLLAKVSELLSA